MTRYNYEEMLEEYKNFSIFRINRNLLFVKLVLFFSNIIGLWILNVLLWATVWTIFILIDIIKLNLITVAEFFIVHFIYWEFIGKTSASDLLKDIEISDLKLSIKALTETKKKKLENK